MIKPVKLFILAASLAAGGCSSGHGARAVYVPPTRLYYAQEKAIQAIQLVPPPAEGSESDRRDLAELLRLQAARTPADCERALKEAASGYENFFGDIGPFSLPLRPEPAAFLRRVRADAARATYAFKKRFARRRPFLRDAGIKPCLKLEEGYAYPSGHSALAVTFALVLADLRPDLRSALLERAANISRGRALGGVHHPSDIEAGKALGAALHAELTASPAYLADVAAMGVYARGEGVKP